MDANTFIESKNRFYAFDIAPGFWRLIEEQATAGVIKSSTVVYQELISNFNDELAQWVTSRKDTLFVAPDQSVQQSLSNIANHVQSTYRTPEARRFLRGADAWVIAHAHASGGIVVTQEVRAGTGSFKVKIPNVCDQFNVQSIDLFQMLRRLGRGWT
jgi:hypothetical protein